MRIAFRADASSQIGLGHLRRCLSLAQALQRLGAEALFLCRSSDVDAQALLAEAGIACRLLTQLPTVIQPGRLADEAADAQACIAILRDEAPALLIVDHYGLTAHWHEALRQALGCRIAVIDDLADRPLSADALIDQNLCVESSHQARYAPWLRRPPARWFCGPGFALLGESYAELEAHVPADEVRSIGIFLGGTDPLALSPIALQACRRELGFQGPIEIVSTQANPHLAALRAAVQADPQTQLSLDLPELSAFYARHDVQIGAAGGAAWERCAVGVPSLTLCLAENQRAVLPELERRQAVLAATGLDAPALAQGLRRLLDDAGLRQRLATNSRALVDGQGARKVAVGLLMLARAPLQLRSAALSDAERLWLWRNHPSTRQVSRSQEEIPLSAHHAWLERMLAAGQSRLYLAYLGSLAVGVIRFDPLPPSDAEAAFEVSLYLDPQLQGLGLGRALLQAGEAAMAATHADLALTIHAEVLPGNESSLGLFRAAGYGPGATPLRFIKRLNS